jgi:hypothetical protein
MKRAQTFLELIFSIIFRFKKTTILLVFLAILSAFYFGYQEHQEQNIETYKVQYGKLQEDVSLTGTVKPSEEANMSFQKTGMVKKIFVDVGEKVKEVSYIHAEGYPAGEIKHGPLALDDEHPIDWWERNKDYITVLEYEPVFVGEPQPTLSFVPYLVGQLERKARQH